MRLPTALSWSQTEVQQWLTSHHLSHVADRSVMKVAAYLPYPMKLVSFFVRVLNCLKKIWTNLTFAVDSMVSLVNYCYSTSPSWKTHLNISTPAWKPNWSLIWWLLWNLRRRWVLWLVQHKSCPQNRESSSSDISRDWNAGGCGFLFCFRVFVIFQRNFVIAAVWDFLWFQSFAIQRQLRRFFFFFKVDASNWEKYLLCYIPAIVSLETLEIRNAHVCRSLCKLLTVAMQPNCRRDVARLTKGCCVC